MLLRRATLAASGHLWLARASSRPPRAPLLLPRGGLAATTRAARTAPTRGAAADPRPRALSSAAAAAASSPPPPPPPGSPPRQRKHRLVFLGTPEPAACVLRSLLEASRHPLSAFEVAAVVTQPAKAQGRGRRAAPPSPVAAAAAEAGFLPPADAGAGSPPPSPASPPPPPLLLCPSSPKDEAFLELLERAVRPDLCVTVAYGGLLPARFLSIPARGTLNVHPSLLPRWRGAAPVQRTLAAGDAECGVSLAFTVLALDAGPVLASRALPTPARATAPELLRLLMERGGELLLRELPRVLSGESSFETATPQAEVERRALEAAARGGAGARAPLASHAARLTRDDGRIDPFSQSLQQAFDRWRSAAGWPGGWLVVRAEGDEGGGGRELRLEAAAPLLEEGAELEAARRAFGASPPRAGALAATRDALLVACADGGILRVTQVKPAGGRAMGAGAWANGLGGRKVAAVAVEEEGGRG